VTPERVIKERKYGLFVPPLPPDKRRRYGGKDINGNQHVKLVVGAKCRLYERDLRRTTGRPRGMGAVRVAVTMMDQINEHFHGDSVSNINIIVYHSPARSASHFRPHSISRCRTSPLPSVIYQDPFNR